MIADTRRTAPQPCTAQHQVLAEPHYFIREICILAIYIFLYSTLNFKQIKVRLYYYYPIV